MRGIGLCLLLAARTLAMAEGSGTAGGGAAPAADPTVALQVELHRHGFSCGSIDGVFGPQTQAALRAFQRGKGLADTGEVDAATQADLAPDAPILRTYTVTAEDLAGLAPVPDTWLEKSRRTSLGYATALELVAEHFHAHPALVQRLNPAVDWSSVAAGTTVVVPAADQVSVQGTAVQIVITLSARELEVTDHLGRVIAHFPVSIARMVEKRPVGALQVTVVVLHPDYTFDPDLFPDSPESQTLGQKLIIPPGPNNPVGVAWIGLNLPGYGIHGTPEPERVGRTESHGCFRLANWDVLTLVRLVTIGMPVLVEP